MRATVYWGSFCFCPKAWSEGGGEVLCDGQLPPKPSCGIYGAGMVSYWKGAAVGEGRTHWMHRQGGCVLSLCIAVVV